MYCDFLCSLSVCLLFVCLRAMLPDLNKMMIAMAPFPSGRRSHSTNHCIHVCNTCVAVSSVTEATTTSTTTTNVTSTFTTQNISILLPLQPGSITVLCVINYNKPTALLRPTISAQFLAVIGCFSFCGTPGMFLCQNRSQ